jgi:hypothetical protein
MDVEETRCVPFSVVPFQQQPDAFPLTTFFTLPSYLLYLTTAQNSVRDAASPNPNT